MAKQGRVGLGFSDRLILLVAWIVTCGLVYVLGFYLGKDTQEQRLGIEERVVRLPVTSRPPPEGQRPGNESELTFYDTLAAGEHAEARPEHEMPRATPPTTIPSRLATTAPSTSPMPAGAGGPPPRPATAAPASTPSPHPAPAAVPVAPPEAVDAARLPPTTRAAAPAPTEAPPPPAGGPPAATAPARPAAAAPPRLGGGFTVQANPTRSRDEAEALYRQLRGRGYDASVVRVLRDGDTWYRVQVGRFATSEQATETMQRLREKEGVSHVFVASE